MSRISPSPDRPIPSNEPTTTAKQVSETESIQKTSAEGEAIQDSERSVTQRTQSTDTRGQQYELHLNGLARQSELLAQLPNSSTPSLKEFPDLHPNLDPNIHLDETIDLKKNVPDGHSINSGLEGLDWGPSKAKTGPGHFGVDITYGGMKAPTNVLDEVLNKEKSGQTNQPPPNKRPGGSMTTADGKAAKQSSGFTSAEGGNDSKTSNTSGGMGMRPGWNLIAADEKSGDKTLLQKAKDGYESAKKAASDAVDVVVDVVMEKFGPPGGGEAIGLLRGPQVVKDVTGDATDLLRGVEGYTTGGNQVKKAKELGDDKTMVDPDAGGGEVSEEEIGRIVKVHSGSIEHGINPDLGLGDGAIHSAEMKRQIDLVRDPIGDGESSVEDLTPERAKLASDIHGPRTVNPDSGFGPVKPDGIKGGADPSDQGNIG